MSASGRPLVPNQPTTSDGFCVVLRDDDARLHRHATVEGAAIEARRLAEKMPDHAFFVLEVTFAAGPVKPPTPFRRVTTPDDGIPF